MVYFSLLGLRKRDASLGGRNQSEGSVIKYGLFSTGAFRATLGAIATAGLVGCQTLPGEGPGATAILAAAGKSATEQNVASASVFDVIDVDAKSARLVSDFANRILNKRFGMGSGGSSAVFGVGDQVRITIFEAGENGLFSTTESKQTVLDLTVQPDGRVPIPYSGSIRFAGRTAEQVRASILSSLKSKAVEPDVIVSSIGTESRSVTVSGDVRSSNQVALSLKGDRLMDAIAKAGGAANAPYESYVTLTRGSRTATVLMKAIVEQPSENIYVQPGDQIYVTHDPRTFTVLGQTASNNRLPFGSNDLNLLEAVALAGGGQDNSVDAKGYFVFRYEDADVVRALLGQQRFTQLLSKGMVPNKYGQFPIVYRFDMARPDSLIAGQTFPVKHRDVIYASRHPAVDLQRFLNLVAQPLSVARGVTSVVE